MSERDRRCSGDESERKPARTEIDWPKITKFFSDEFRAPRVPSCSDLNTEAARKGADKTVEAVETALLGPRFLPSPYWSCWRRRRLSSPEVYTGSRMSLEDLSTYTGQFLHSRGRERGDSAGPTALQSVGGNEQSHEQRDGRPHERV
jgi:hypothetical protein